MSNAEQVALGTTLAGTNQYKVFASVMSQMATAQDAYNTALNSNGSAWEENEKYMESLSAKLQALKTEWQEFVLGDGGLVEAAKFIVDLGTKILKFANSDLGKLTVATTALMIVMNSTFAKNMISSISALGSSVLNLAGNFMVAALQGEALNVVVDSIGKGNLIILGLSASIFVLKKAYDQLTTSTQKQIDKLEESKSEIESNQSELKSLEQQIQDINDQIEQNKIDKFHLTDDDEKEKLEANTEELEKQRQILENQLILIQRKLQAEEKEQEEEAVETGQNQTFGTGGYNTTYGHLASVQTKLSANREQQQEVEDQITEANKLGTSTDQLTAKKEKLQAQEEELINKGNEYAQQLSDIDGSIYGVTSEGIAMKDSNEELIDSWVDMTGEQSTVQSSMEDTEEDESELVTRTEELQDAISEYSSVIDELQSAYNTVSSAMAELNENGSLSIDTFQSLMGVSASYLAALQDENGQYAINQTTLSNLVEQMKIAKIEELQEAAAADVLAYATGDVDSMSDFAKQTVSALGDNIEDAGDQASTAAGKMLGFAEGVQVAVNASQGEDPTAIDYDEEHINAIINGYKKIGDQIANLTVDTQNYGDTASSSSSSASSAITEMSNKITKAYKKQIDAIKKIKEEQTKAIETQVDNLKKERDAQEKVIDAQIDALTKLKEARERYWEEQLDALEKENTEREQNIKLQEKQEALAQAQQTRVMVFKDGQFQYGEDEDAVSSAQGELIDTENDITYEQQKQLIEDLRDAEIQAYEDRINALEDYKDRMKESYDEQIDMLNEYKEYLEDYFDEQIDDLEEQRDAIKEQLEEGTLEQQEAWNKMLSQLNTFVDSWNNKVSTMQFPAGGNVTLTHVGVSADSTGNNYVNGYASGTSSIGDNQVALVGDNPKYHELVIGSNINNDIGTVMSLKRGSGVVNATATNTLASIFNSLKGSNVNGLTQRSDSSGQSISIGNITLPQVKNGSDFISYLQNFSTDITQMSYARA